MNKGAFGMTTGPRPDQETAALLSRLVQVGRVSDVDNESRRATVFFPATKIVSDWLYVPDCRPYIPDYDGVQQTEEEEGGTGEASFASHAHKLIIRPWMPKIGDMVLVLYLPVYGADGFILGRIL